jgi:hypothetical protein
MLWDLAGRKDQAPAADKGFSMLTAAAKKSMSGQGVHRKKKSAKAKIKTSKSTGKNKAARKKKPRRRE